MPIASGGGAGERTAKLLLASGGRLVAIRVCGGGGVDLGAVGRALGLDPSSVRLNGHFVSRGPDLVSSLTWQSLLSFFASRGLPAGASELDPVVVQGKPALASGMQFSSVLEEGGHLAFKRKVSLEEEHALKKNKVNGCNSGSGGAGDGYLSDDDSLCIKRRLKLEDDNSSKKRKITDCSSSLMHGSPKSPAVIPSIGFSFGCINGHGKRMRQDDLGQGFETLLHRQEDHGLIANAGGVGS